MNAPATFAQLLAADPNVSPALKAAIAPVAVRGSARWLEVRDECRSDEIRDAGHELDDEAEEA